MATKTWKLGEWCKGGIITVKTSGKKITLILKDWDFSKGSRSSSDQSEAKEIDGETFDASIGNPYRDLYQTLSDWTTSYYAEKIIEWIQTKVEFTKQYFW